jgi:predicted nucleotidyltransferase component of viral defense system
MKLHESPKDFKAAIEAAAQHLKMRPVFIEKDYWVTFVLKNLSQSAYKDIVVFKGGTSLSKAYGCIERFSEDIDLAIVSPTDYTGSKLSTLLKKISSEITKGLSLIEGHEAENKMGKIRATVYSYNRVLDSSDFGVVKDYILVEINCFANPVPHNKKPIQTYIAQFLNESGQTDLIKEYELENFEVNVLSMQRTYFEKVLSVNRLSYEGKTKLEEKIRHFYDIHQLHYHEDLKGKILSTESYTILDAVRKDDEAFRTVAGDWQGKKIAESPLFDDIESSWKDLASSYETGLSGLIWAKQFASAEDVLRVLKEIKSFAILFDEAHPPGLKDAPIAEP